MRKVLRHILEILDGTPAIKGRNQRGQSTVELALVTPLLIILIVGIVEVGWFANNYLSLLETTRVGARRGATLNADVGPVAWPDRASLNPNYDDTYDPRFDPSFAGNPGTWEDPAEWAEVSADRVEARICPPTGGAGFYTLILCQMLISIDPLVIRADQSLPEEEQTDDVIISVFSVQMIENSPTGDVDFDAIYAAEAPPAEIEDRSLNEYEADRFEPVVVGRYPISTNECTVFEGSTGEFVPNRSPLERDPFDYIVNERTDLVQIDYSSSGLPTNPDGTLDRTDPAFPTGLDLPDFYNVELPGYDDNSQMEAQRGWNYTGFRQVELDPVNMYNPFLGANEEVLVKCFGSEWTVYDIQNLMRTRSFELSADELADIRATDPFFGRENCTNPADPATCEDVDTRQFLTNQGLVLVEIYWQHELLLDIPAFSPVFNALGGDRTTIYVWSAFPIPTASPNLDFVQTWEDFYTP